jgi:SIR2-like domain
VTLVVIGAGATRGASFVDEAAGRCLPPLDADFFTQIQRINEAKHQSVIEGVIKSAVDLFGVNFRSTLEEMFTVLEHALRMTRALEKKQRRGYEQAREFLLQGLAAVLEESLADGNTHRSCAYHKHLVQKLAARDAIISFNYDCLMDTALKLDGSGKWNARYGYSLPLPRGRTQPIGEAEWQPTSPSKKADTIRLLKLHGSTHFRRAKRTLMELKRRPYTRQHGNVNFEIIPPESQKRFDEGVYAKLWHEASREIGRATSMVVIGYSFPPSDQHASALFRLSVRRDHLKKLCIVNPDREARYRARDILWQGISNSTRVSVFDRFKEFAAADPALWQ